MRDDLLIQKWLSDTPAYESVRVVRGVLVRAFGEDAICKRSGDSHQFRVKHHVLAGLPGFGPFGYVSIPVANGQRVKGYYLRQIAIAIRHLEELSDAGQGKPEE